MHFHRTFLICASSLALSIGMTSKLLAASAASATTQTTERVSVDSAGAQVHDESYSASISADGRFVAFESQASTLVASDTNGFRDVFVHDRVTGETTRVNVNSSGVQSNGVGDAPALSADGRFVAFTSEASNLVVGDTNGWRDVFVHDRVTGETARVSVSSAGVESNAICASPSISADGRFVAFETGASSLVVGDINGFEDVFVHDRLTGVTTRASVSSTGVEGNQFSLFPVISADGNWVAFMSFADSLVPGDTNSAIDIFVHSRSTGETTRVSVDSSGLQGSGLWSFTQSISADGRFVNFQSDFSNLVAGDTNGASDVFVHDQTTGETTRVSVDSAGTEGDSASFVSSISGDGRFVAFSSNAGNLVADDTNGWRDFFVHDRVTGSTSRVSVDSTGAQANDGSGAPSISADGQLVTFESPASNLVAGDTNSWYDVFVHDRGQIDSCSALQYCVTSPNSVGAGATIGSSGSTSVSQNNLTLEAQDLPPNNFGIFFYGQNQIQTVFGDGYRCVGGGLGRLPVTTTDAAGHVAWTLDVNNPPIPSHQITPGSTWNFQFWYRDPQASGAGFNLTNGLQVDFCD